ncbi:ATP-dependent DNA helicase [Microbulbifer sp. PAAF003]|uniref:ATP-dependent DNA helicase n=1 Tax=Microbulbifer sp. PAAF003 TaxID=3243375 RepID=UPI00403A2AFA
MALALDSLEPAETLNLSVGELVAFSCRSGDLIREPTSGPSAQEGIRAHQKLQNQRPKGAEAEYKLKTQIDWMEQQVTLSGRVDIFHPKSDLHKPAQLDEIKTTYLPPSKLPEAAKKLHWAQLKIYGYCHLVNEGATDGTDTVALQVVWYNLKERKAYTECIEYPFSELETFTLEALTKYLCWHRAWQEHRQQLIDTAKQLAFPFPQYRPGQRQLAVEAYRCFRDGGELVAEAPTGTGKTISTLFPAIKAIGEEKLDQLVYLTAKNSGRQMVRETIEALQASGLQLSLLEIQAREKTCACNLGLCTRDDDGICPRTRGFYDRLPVAMDALLGRPQLTPKEIADVADQQQICPFELSLQILPWVDLVVCDFNYVFDPLVRLTSFQDQRNRRALLVDEAHNLIDRAQEMYSAKLSRRDSRRAANACKGHSPTLRRSIQSLVRAIENWIKRLQEVGVAQSRSTFEGGEVWVTAATGEAENPESVSRAVQKVLSTVSQLIESSQSPPEEIAEWLRSVYRYAVIEQELCGQHKVVTRVIDRDTPWQEQEIKLLCLNAAQFLQRSYQQNQAAILFSATLRPASYIYSQLGVEHESPYLRLPSPFQPQQQGVFLCPYIDTRYQARDRSIENLVDIISRTFYSRAGNYLVFFPSYRYLEQVAESFKARFPEVSLLQQLPGQGETERAEFLSGFNEGNKSLGFAIMGGIFGEGIDYVGEKLVGTIIVGTGLPQVNVERELQRDAAETTGIHGFDIAYRYPGMTRVLQTAGRVIRSESDRGVIILVDSRFSEPFYWQLFPKHWQPAVCRNTDQLTGNLEQFWSLS